MPNPTRSNALEKTGQPSEAAAAEGKSRRVLAGLMEGISRCRAEIARREHAASGLRRRLIEELHPLEEKIRDVRLDTFRILGKHLQSGHLNRRGQKDLLLALCDLADELESMYGLDLRDDRRRFFEEENPSDGEEPSGEVDADPGGEYDWEGLYRGQQGAKRGRDWDARNEEARPKPGSDAEEAETDGRGDGGPDRRKSKAQERRERREETLAGDIRALYLMLARALHPDKESDPARLAGKTAWMQKVTAAYAARDLAGLLDILATNPLDAVGPYLLQAPRKTVDGFAKRLRRELDALRATLAGLDAGADRFEAVFLKDGKVNEPAYNNHLAAARKELQSRKRLRELYRTSDGARSLADALRTRPWRELL
jgi:hypothetical protein